MKFYLHYILIFSCIALASCSGTTEQTDNIKPTKEMKGFMEMLDGSYKGITAAMEKYAEKEIVDDDITRLDLEKPKLVKLQESGRQRCYTMEASIGITQKVFVICWEGKKIFSIEDKGFKE